MLTLSEVKDKAVYVPKQAKIYLLENRPGIELTACCNATPMASGTPRFLTKSRGKLFHACTITNMSSTPIPVKRHISVIFLLSSSSFSLLSLRNRQKLTSWLSPSVKQCQNPFSGPPLVYQYLTKSHDWPVKNAPFDLPIRGRFN